MDLNEKIEARRRELEIQKSQQRDADLARRKKDAEFSKKLNSSKNDVQKNVFQKKLTGSADGKMSLIEKLCFSILIIMALLGFLAAWWIGLGFTFWALCYLGKNSKLYKAKAIEEAE